MSGAEPKLAAVHGQNPERRQSTSQQRKNWGPACSPGAYERVDLHGEGRVTVDKRIVPAVEALSAVLAAHGYETRRADTGAYNCRPITGAKPPYDDDDLSLHAFGIAIDINWTTNGYGKPGRVSTDMPKAMTDAIKSITTNSGARVWEWGGDWTRNVDYMHFEIDCTPADLATGLRATPAKPAPPKGWLMALTDTEQQELLDKTRDIHKATVGDKSRLAGIRTDLTDVWREVIKARGGDGRGYLQRRLDDLAARLPKPKG